jgi:hypothetical protein
MRMWKKREVESKFVILKILIDKMSGELKVRF